MHQWDPKDYARSSGAQQSWAEELIGRLHLAGDERILDIGCGDGRVTAALAERVPKGSVVGVDSSTEMIEFASEQYADRKPKLTFLVMDAGGLSFRNEFDVVFSNAALHWVEDHVPVVQGIADALRPGGRALLSMGGKGNVADTVVVARALTQEPRWAEYFEDWFFTYAFHAPENYRTWLADAGLEPLRVELVPKDMVHTPEQFAAWIRTTWIRYTQRVPEDRREEFVEALVARYVERCPLDAEGLVHTQMVRLEVQITKPG